MSPDPSFGPAPAAGLPAGARAELLAALRHHALVIGEVTLTSGASASYLIDAKRAILLRAGFLPLAELVCAQARAWSATAVGGMTMGADPIACAALAGGADVKAFFVRKEAKAHGLSRRIEGPLLDAQDRCMLVEDVVTTGASTLRALEALRDEGREVCGVLAICDRLAGGGEAIARRAGVPYVALTTIDEVYPDRPDRSEPRSA
jgi:orotate phosphoribosyltransferase